MGLKRRARQKMDFFPDLLSTSRTFLSKWSFPTFPFLWQGRITFVNNLNCCKNESQIIYSMEKGNVQAVFSKIRTGRTDADAGHVTQNSFLVHVRRFRPRTLLSSFALWSPSRSDRPTEASAIYARDKNSLKCEEEKCHPHYSEFWNAPFCCMYQRRNCALNQPPFWKTEYGRFWCTEMRFNLCRSC